MVKEKKTLQNWIDTPLKSEKLAPWIDGPVAKRWGVKAAARALHIAKTGRDAEIVPFLEKVPPSQKEVRIGEPVPGSSKPAKNLYALSQVLTWLASQRHDVEDQLMWQRDVPELMQSLVNS